MRRNDIMFVPFSRTFFTIQNSNLSVKEVENHFRKLINLMKQNEADFYTTKMGSLKKQLTENEIVVRGSLNSLGRKLGIDPSFPPKNNHFNFAEMFRVNILSHLAGVIQREFLCETMMNEKFSDREVQQKWYDTTHKHVSIEYIKRIRRDLFSRGIISGSPTPSGKLIFSATDGHYRKISQHGTNASFTVKINGKSTTLLFKIPKKVRFQGEKITAPTVQIDRNGKLRFYFAIQKTKPTEIPTNSVLGIDLGVVKPYTATLVGEDFYSQPLTSAHKANSISKKIFRCEKNMQTLWSKEQQNKETHPEKSKTQRTERLRIRSKVSRLKIERAKEVAKEITQIAYTHHSIISLENLKWVPNSHWEQSITQNAIQNKANTVGVKVIKINPKNTSQTCPYCANEAKDVQHRGKKCVKCEKLTDRDTLASRMIALRALKQKKLPAKYLRIQKNRVEERTSRAQDSHPVLLSKGYDTRLLKSLQPF